MQDFDLENGIVIGARHCNYGYNNEYVLSQDKNYCIDCGEELMDCDDKYFCKQCLSDQEEQAHL